MIELIAYASAAAAFGGMLGYIFANEQARRRRKRGRKVRGVPGPPGPMGPRGPSSDSVADRSNN